MKEVYDKFGLETGTRDFVGHSMALYTTDEYINEKGMAKDAVTRIRLYVNSMARYGKSPYIYPLYGLGELPQGFARLSAIYGGTYMLNTNVDEVLYEGGKAIGIKATMKEKGEPGDGMKFETKAKKILADPSYFPSKVQVTGHLLKAICILNHPIPNTNDSDSLQLIIPQSQVGRKNGEAIFSTLRCRKHADHILQISILLWSRGHTMFARKATTLLSSALSLKHLRTTT
jgi:Rab GDP dissociation inhibitor